MRKNTLLFLFLQGYFMFNWYFLYEVITLVKKGNDYRCISFWDFAYCFGLSLIFISLFLIDKLLYTDEWIRQFCSPMEQWIVSFLKRIFRRHK
jgi:hypothetical protein